MFIASLENETILACFGCVWDCGNGGSLKCFSLRNTSK